MAELIGTTAVSRVSAGDKFRVIWEYWGASVLPAWSHVDAVIMADRIRDWLPSEGFIPVSMPTAQSGDEVVVYDVRLAQTWSNGRNVSQVLDALGNVPGALRVQKLERLSGMETSSELAEGLQGAITSGGSAANTNAIFGSVEDFLKAARGALGTAAQLTALVAVAVIVAGGIYLYRETRK